MKNKKGAKKKETEKQKKEEIEEEAEEKMEDEEEPKNNKTKEEGNKKTEMQKLIGMECTEFIENVSDIIHNFVSDGVDSMEHIFEKADLDEEDNYKQNLDDFWKYLRHEIDKNIDRLELFCAKNIFVSPHQFGSNSSSSSSSSSFNLPVLVDQDVDENDLKSMEKKIDEMRSRMIVVKKKKKI